MNNGINEGRIASGESLINADVATLDVAIKQIRGSQK